MKYKFAQSGNDYWIQDEKGIKSKVGVQEYQQMKKAQETGAFDAFMTGAGKTFQNIGEGIGLRDPMPGADFAMEKLREARPYSTGAGEIAPTLIGPIKGGLALQSAYGAVAGALSAPTGQRQAGAAMGAGGAAFGDMVGRVIGRARNAIKEFNEPDLSGVPRKLDEAGYKLTPAQRSGSQAMMKVERGIEKNPWNQSRFGEIGDFNSDLLSSRVNESIGLPPGSGPLDRNARTMAAERIGNDMQNIASGVDMDIPESLALRVRKIISNDDMLEIPELKAGGTIDGSDYMRIRSDLSRAQRSAQGSTKDYIGKTIKQMDDEFMAVAGGEQAAAYRVAREQYKNLSVLERGSSLTPDGNVNIRSAGNAFRSKQGYGKRGIDNTLPETKRLIDDLDNLSSKAVNPYIGNSGTPEGIAALWMPGTWPGGLLGGAYLKNKWNLKGLMQPAGGGGIALGANIGRSAGLLQNRE